MRLLFWSLFALLLLAAAVGEVAVLVPLGRILLLFSVVESAAVFVEVCAGFDSVIAPFWAGAAGSSSFLGSVLGSAGPVEPLLVPVLLALALFLSALLRWLRFLFFADIFYL